ncbi:MAG: response regulator [Acidobacteriota bacterium]
MGKKILVVDDEMDAVTYFSTVLKDNGYDTITAVDGLEALKKMRSDKPDLVTLDITMPEKSGVGAYREMKNDPDLKKIPVVIVTGVTHDFKKFISTRHQVPPPEGYLEKPVKPEDLVAEVKKHIG